MASILHLARRLDEVSAMPAVRGLRIRSFRGPSDVPIWLQLRDVAFAGERPLAGPWTADDFDREFLRQPWWRPERLWFAEEALGDGEAKAVGTVTLALRGEGPARRAAIHWLAVLPQCRRRGIGRLLVATAEAAAWHAGCRQVHVETHALWRSAVALYRSLGYKDDARA